MRQLLSTGVILSLLRYPYSSRSLSHFNRHNSIHTFHNNNFTISSEQQQQRSPKRRKVEDDDASNGFRAATDVNNASDLTENKTPLLPRDCRTLLLDIEGCTTSISFVHDVLFPFARNHVKKYLSEEGVTDGRDKTAIYDALVEDMKNLAEDHPSRKEFEGTMNGESSSITVDDKIVNYVNALMNHDVKATGLKGLQGKIWKAGYVSGELKGHIYDDFRPLLEWCKSQGVSVSIYSSGSIDAQKMLFGHSTSGDLCAYFQSHFDTTSGGKKEAESYRAIAKAMKLKPEEICFVSDAEAELVAAKEAGIGYPVMSVRAGNKPLTDVGREFPIISSLLQLCGSGK